MRLTIIFDEKEVSLPIAARAVTKYRNDPNQKVVVVDNESYIVNNTKGTSLYAVKSAEQINRFFRKEQ